MGKMKYLNVGCGNKYHKDWVNIDLASVDPDVIVCDLLKRIPFDDNVFDVVYLSQVLEHFSKKDALVLIRECYRVLKTGGIIRVVVPDLENIVRNYLRFLEENLKHPTAESEANYEWIMVEMYDQTVRNAAGGEMIELMVKEKAVNEEFVLGRLGLAGRTNKENYLRELKKTKIKLIQSRLLKAVEPRNFKKVLSFLMEKTAKLMLYLLGMNKELKHMQIGKFRMSGENHYWMYDRYSLGKLLASFSFREIKLKTPFESDIPAWAEYALDVKNGEVYDPTSLFMEAKKLF